MTIEQLREMHRARPFQPFDIHVTDGRTFRVDHPEFLIQSRSSRTITVSLPDDRSAVVALPHVVSLEPSPNERRGRRGRQAGGSE